MEWSIVYKKVKASKAIEEYVHEKVNRECNKFALNFLKASVVISQSGHDYVAACTIVGAGSLKVHVEGKGSETHAAIDQMIHKLDLSLKKNKDKIKAHSHPSKEVLAGMQPELSEGDADPDDVPVDAEDLLTYEEKKNKKNKQSA